MSIASKAGLLVGVVGAVATLATSAEGGEGGHGKKFRGYYVVGSPVRVIQPQTVYVAPPPRVVYAPAPVYADPGYFAPAQPGLNINIPLR